MRVQPAVDEDGAPVLLLAGASVVVPTKSGNAAHEVATGQFGSTGRRKKDEKKPQAKPDASAGSDQRRRDAVVDAARTISDLTPAGVEKFMRSRWRGDRAITQDDIDAFARDAKLQRIHDVIDALDFRMRKAQLGRAGTRHAHVIIPRGLQRKTLRSLDRDELLVVFTRLRERGWDNRQIKRHVRRLDDDQRRLQGLLD